MRGEEALDPSKDQNFVYLEGRLIPGPLEVVEEGDWKGLVMHADVETDHPAFGGRIPVLIVDHNALFAEAMIRIKSRPDVVVTGFVRHNGNGSVVVVARRVRFLEPREVRRQAALMAASWRRLGQVPARPQTGARDGRTQGAVVRKG